MFTKSLIIATIASVAVASESWHQCAVEGENCLCASGQVRYGVVQADIPDWGQTYNGMHDVTCNNSTFKDEAHLIEKICQCKLILADPIVRKKIVIHTAVEKIISPEDQDTLTLEPLEDDDAIKTEWEKGFVTPDTWASYVANNAAHQAVTQNLRIARATAAMAYINAQKAAVADSATLTEATKAQTQANAHMNKATTLANKASSANDKAITKASDAKTEMGNAIAAGKAALALAKTNNVAAKAAADTANDTQTDLVSKANKKAVGAKADMVAAAQKHTDAVAHQGAMKTILDSANTTHAGAQAKLTKDDAAVVASRKAAEDAHKAFVDHTQSSTVTGNF